MKADLEVIHCPTCGQRLEVSPGSRLACPACGQHLSVETIRSENVAVNPPSHGTLSTTTKGTVRTGLRKDIWELVRIIMVIGGAFLAIGFLFQLELWTRTEHGFGAGVVLLILGFYFAPTISAMLSRHPHGGGIAIINLFLGWTFIGWVVAAAWAAAAPSKR